MNIKKILIPLMALLIAVPGLANEKMKYKNPTGKEFPILAWYSVLGDSNQTKERYQELREAGFNISFPHFGTAAELEKGLAACKGTGVKIMAMCTELVNNTAATVNRFKDNPSVAGWFLRDEPVTSGYAELRKLRDRIYAADKSHLMYLNLLPCMVAPQDLQAKDYEDYVQRFVNEVNITPISYDMYPVVMENGKAKLRPMFYENLEIVRKVSLRNDYPFWAFCLATAHDPYPIPSDTHLRIEAFSALAYGAQCIQYFTYWTPGTTVWNFHNAPIDENGKRTDVYYKVKNVNKEIQALAKVFLGAKATDVSHTGDSIPTGTKSLTQMPPKFQSIQSNGEGILVSQLVNGKNKYVMLVNRSIDDAQTVTFYLDQSVKRVMPFNGETKLNVGKQTLTLSPGNYAIFRIK